LNFLSTQLNFLSTPPNQIGTIEFPINKLRERSGYYPIRVASEVVSLPGKEGEVKAEVMAMKVGPYLFLTMPGEPMVEYGFKIEDAIGPRAIPIVVGYANGGIGYIATADSYAVGGYEPNMSPLSPSAEPIVLKKLGGLADKVIGDVFATFSKRPKDVKKREAEEKVRLKKAGN
jgi:neutral ceramidase